MSPLFHAIEGETAIIRCKGVFRQVGVFHRNNELFLAYGSGFIRAMAHGRTSVPTVFVEWINPQLIGAAGKFDRCTLSAEVTR